MDTYSPELSIQHNVLQNAEPDFQSHANELIKVIEDGDLEKLEAYIQSYEDEAVFFASVVSVAAKQFSHPTLEILPCVAQAVNRNCGSKNEFFALLSISLISPSYCKVISVCTNRRWETRVVAGPMRRGLVSFRPAIDDPSILMRQIGALARMGVTTPPPSATD